MLTRLRVRLSPLALLRPVRHSLAASPRIAAAALRCISSDSNTPKKENLREVADLGTSFVTAAEYDCAFVDKSQFIRPILEDELCLFSPFPRRFGKTWFVGMLNAARQGRYDLFRVRVC